MARCRAGFFGLALGAACASVDPARGELLALPDCELWYRVEGRGHPLVLVHGAAHSGVFLPTASELASSSMLVFYDQRGWGRTRVAADAPRATLATDVADLEALRVHLGCERIDLLALSNGGPIAIDYALAHPERVRRLVLASTYADNDARIELAQVECKRVLDRTLAERERIAAADLTPSERAVAEFLVMPHTQHHRPVTRDLAAEWVATGVLGGPSQPGSESPIARDYRRLDALARVDVPTLVIAGRHDCVTPLPHSRELARRLSAGELVMLDECGHLAHLDQPAAFVAAVRGFLAAQ